MCHTLSHFLTGTNGNKQTFHKYFAKSNTKIIIITENNNIAPIPAAAPPAAPPAPPICPEKGSVFLHFPFPKAQLTIFPTSNNPIFYIIITNILFLEKLNFFKKKVSIKKVFYNKYLIKKKVFYNKYLIKKKVFYNKYLIKKKCL